MRYRIKLRWQRISRGIKGIFTENLLSKLIALVVAILLYMLTTGEENVVTNLKVRLEVVTPVGLVLANTLPGEVNFQIRGPRARIDAVLDRNEVLTVPLTDARAGISSVKIHSEMLRLPPGVEVTAISPAVIEPRLEPLASKEVEVKLFLEGEVADGYRLVSTQVKPPRIEIKGSATKLAKISEIYTVPVPINGFTDTVEKEVDVAITGDDFMSEGITPVKVVIMIEPIMRGKIFRNIPVSVSTRYKAVVTPKTLIVKVWGPEVHMRELTADQIKVEIDLSDRDPGWYRQKISVKVPEPIEVQEVTPPTVRVQLR